MNFVIFNTLNYTYLYKNNKQPNSPKSWLNPVYLLFYGEIGQKSNNW